MKTKPETLEQKYLFLVDSQELAFAVIAAGYQAIALLNDKDGFYNTDTFIAYMSGLVCAGTYQTDYCYVPACSTQKINDTLEYFFQENYLTCHKGWMLFKDKDYLEKLEYADELKNVLYNFILRFEGSREEKLNLDRFHKFNEKGKRIGVFDLEIVDYLLQTVHFFVVKEIPYVYEQGCYHADPSGIRLKAHIQKLMYRDVVKSATIQGFYQLLLSQESIQKSFSDLNNQPSHWVNFLNGYFDVIEWKMLPHNTKYLMINQIPYEFHPEDDEQILQGGNHIQNFFEFSIPNQLDQKMYWQYLGYCMTTDTQFQKFLMIKGAGGTGKSVLISFTQKLIGTENYCSLSLQNLNQRFYPTALFGKTLNACADIPSEALKQVAIVKKAVGEDMLLYEKRTKILRCFSATQSSCFLQMKCH